MQKAFIVSTTLGVVCFVAGLLIGGLGKSSYPDIVIGLFLFSGGFILVSGFLNNLR